MEVPGKQKGHKSLYRAIVSLQKTWIFYVLVTDFQRRNRNLSGCIKNIWICVERSTKVLQVWNNMRASRLTCFEWTFSLSLICNRPADTSTTAVKSPSSSAESSNALSFSLKSNMVPSRSLMPMLLRASRLYVMPEMNVTVLSFTLNREEKRTMRTCRRYSKINTHLVKPSRCNWHCLN